MASQVFQFDGAQDSSSESDFEKGLKMTSLQGVQLSASLSNGNESNILFSFNENDSPCSPLPNGCPKIDSTWIGQDLWSEKNEMSFLEYFPNKNQNFLSFSPNKNLVGSTNYSEFANNLFESNGVSEIYTSLSSVSPYSNLESIFVEPSTAIVDSQCNKIENYSSINTNPIQISTSAFENCCFNTHLENEIKRSATECTVEPACEVILGDQSKSTSASFESVKRVPLTLKQYLRNFGELVSIDLKNFRGQEMVVVEYKPIPDMTGRRYNKNKFLIQPLDKFLENWNLAEEKTNEDLTQKLYQSTEQEEEELFKQSHTVEANSVVNKFFNKINNSRIVTDRPVVNEKLNAEGKESLRERLPLFYHSNQNCGGREKKFKCRKRKKIDCDEFRCSVESVVDKISCNNKTQRSSNILKCCKPSSQNIIHKKLNENEKCKNISRIKGSKETVVQESQLKQKKSWNYRNEKVCEELTEVDLKLIKDLNSRFEDYFQNIVRIKGDCKKKLGELLQKQMSNSQCEINDFLVKNFENKDIANDDKETHADSNIGSLKFVTQLLSTFSIMSRNPEMPPLSITINIGNSGELQSIPVSLNLGCPLNKKKVKEIKCDGKSLKRKIRIQNLDGLVDSSSSDGDSEKCSVKKDSSAQKKFKKEAHYKALKVVRNKRSSEKKVESKRKRKTLQNSEKNNCADDEGENGGGPTSPSCSAETSKYY